MKNLLRLIAKDLRRDLKHPWGILLFMAVPVLTAVLMALVFAPSNGSTPDITIHVALLDDDDDLLAQSLRSLSGQGGDGGNLQIHTVESETEGIKLLEKRKVSAFVIFPENLTLDLLDGKQTSITLYKNPAEAILPRLIEEALNTAATAVALGINLLQPEISTIREMIEEDSLPSASKVALVAGDIVERLRTVEPYFFPPLVQLDRVDISEYVPTTSPAPSPEEAP